MVFSGNSDLDANSLDEVFYIRNSFSKNCGIYFPSIGSLKFFNRRLIQKFSIDNKEIKNIIALIRGEIRRHLIYFSFKSKLRWKV
jgi:hypothetical protein